MAKKIYLSPSDQDANRYAYGNTYENVQCCRIANALETALKRCGFEVKNNQKSSMEGRVEESNRWDADLHVPIHSNAYNGKVGGTRIFSFDTSGAGYKAAKCVYKHLAPLTPGTSDSQSAYPALYEIKYAYAPTVYIETEFHDVPEYAKWIINHVNEIGEAICKGICEYFGVTYKAPATPKPATPTTSNVLYRVQVGAYSVKANAERMQKELKSKGYDAIIVTVNK